MLAFTAFYGTCNVLEILIYASPDWYLPVSELLYLLCKVLEASAVRWNQSRFEENPIDTWAAFFLALFRVNKNDITFMALGRRSYPEQLTFFSNIQIQHRSHWANSAQLYGKRGVQTYAYKLSHFYLLFFRSHTVCVHAVVVQIFSVWETVVSQWDVSACLALKQL